ncbi:MAG: class I SAM-dependent methyltransferase [Deltaproteobacteria bacterium]|jgi:SAM-dependent methyltransferase|nr:class I SAM-dependent methyltransferase [Deltaproteobacteria bacterium]
MSLESQLIQNWTDSSAKYSGIVGEELNSFKKKAWSDLIAENSPGEAPLRILDIGTGPGFFAIITTLAGHKVTAIDCTEAMIAEASANAERLGLAIDFKVSDSQNLAFPDSSFDLVISRNVAWTLFDASRAYREWWRVLSPGGRALIFDANWNISLFDEARKRAYDVDVAEYRKRFPEREVPFYTDEMLDFRRRMPQCQRIRPQWDFGALLEAGYGTVFCDMTVGSRVYDEAERLLYRSTPMFLLRAEKR